MSDNRQSRLRGTTVDWCAALGRAMSTGLPAALALVVQLACGGVADDNKLPPNVQDPATLKTPAGALARYRGALAHLPATVDEVILTGGILTDELAALPAPPRANVIYATLDSRTDASELSGVNAQRLYNLRGQAHEAHGFLAAYAPDSSPALQGLMYAIEGYTEVWLADLFCSGIPLSTVDFEGNYTLTPGFTTSEVYKHAAVLFDSALALAGDSVSVRHLAAVGKGRALVARGAYTEAAAVVSGVPDDYAYQVPFSYSLPASPSDSAMLWYFAFWYHYRYGAMSVGDREGQNGLDYRSSGDPRTAVVLADPMDSNDPYGNVMYFPAKYPLTGTAMYTVASGVEARLIEAEAALQAGSDEWLTKLNALRTDGTYDMQPSRTDTLWHAGSGGVAGLRPLADPGTPSARVDLVFRERAFWLYLTGHRQGDLRRLIRDYPGHSSNTVYPTGTYSGGGGMYGDEVVMPFPDSERELNPKYTGCFHRGA